jgi:hypothetical protein
LPGQLNPQGFSKIFPADATKAKIITTDCVIRAKKGFSPNYTTPG